MATATRLGRSLTGQRWGQRRQPCQGCLGRVPLEELESCRKALSVSPRELPGRESDKTEAGGGGARTVTKGMKVR